MTSTGDISFTSTDDDAQKLDLDISSSAWPLTFKLILAIFGLGLVGGMCFYGWNIGFDRDYTVDGDPSSRLTGEPTVTNIPENQLTKDDQQIESLVVAFGLTTIILNVLIFAAPFLFRGKFKLSKTVWRVGMIFSLMVIGFLGGTVALTFTQMKKSPYRPTRNVHVIGTLALLTTGIVVLSRIARFFTRESMTIVLIFGGLSLYTTLALNGGKTGAIIAAATLVVAIAISNRLPISVELGMATLFLAALSMLTSIWIEGTGPVSFFIRDDSAFAQTFGIKK